MRYTIAKPHDKRIKELEVRSPFHNQMAEHGTKAPSYQEVLIPIGSGNKERFVITISGLGSEKTTIIISTLKLSLCRLPVKGRRIFDLVIRISVLI